MEYNRLMENKHYICLGECEGVSTKTGVCVAVECDKYDQDLLACTCTDGEHNVPLEEDNDN